MKSIDIFSVYKINGKIKQWKKMFPSLNINRTYVPSENSYVIFKYNRINVEYPIEAVAGAQKGFIEGWINKPFSNSKIFQIEEFESKLKEMNEKANNS